MFNISSVYILRYLFDEKDTYILMAVVRRIYQD